MTKIIGVDVSKARLDVFRREDAARLTVGNDRRGVARLAAWAGEDALVVMAASGGCERLAHRRLTERGTPAAIVNAKRVRDFARAGGLLKTDRLERGDDRPLRRLRPAPGRRRPRSATRPAGNSPSCSPTGSG
jgi:transposase